MRMCGHAHHDDMLYLGKDPQPSWDYPPLTPQGYADAKLYEYWKARDPISTYASKLESLGLLSAREFALMKDRAEAMVESEARAVLVWRGDERTLPPEARRPEIGIVTSADACLEILNTVPQRNRGSSGLMARLKRLLGLSEARA